MVYCDSILVGDQVVYKGATVFRLSPEATVIPDLSVLKELKRLDMSGCHKVTDLSPLSNLVPLSHLRLAGCTGIKDLGPLASLVDLWDLNLSGCTGVVDVSPIAILPFLWRVCLTDCTGLEDLSSLRSKKERGCDINLPWLYYLPSHKEIPWWQRPKNV